MNVDLTQVQVRPDATVREVMACIQRNAFGIALVVVNGRLLATVTDGDIRTAILQNTDLAAPITEVLRYKARLPFQQPIVAPLGTSRSVLVELMQAHGIRHVPLVDEDGRVRDLALRDTVPGVELSVTAVVMAGGLGVRLRPLTDVLPKPMLPMGEKPLIERILNQLQAAGIEHVTVTTHYKPDAIVGHLGDGAKFGLRVDYVNEAQPLGTAGSLKLLEAPKGPQLVINGDILTDLDFRRLVTYHQDQHADMTVGVRKYEFRVDYGVVETEGVRITGLREKPTLGFVVNAGIYLVEPAVYAYIPEGRRFDMTELIQQLLANGRPVVSFLIHEYWLDIGRPADYARAVADLGARPKSVDESVQD